MDMLDATLSLNHGPSLNLNKNDGLYSRSSSELSLKAFTLKDPRNKEEQKEKSLSSASGSPDTEKGDSHMSYTM